jgi:SHS2 domain-containing protein
MTTNTEDSNELDTLKVKALKYGREVYLYTGSSTAKYSLDKALDELLSYIQSNYILKSDVEKIEAGYQKLLLELRNHIKESSK